MSNRKFVFVYIAFCSLLYSVFETVIGIGDVACDETQQADIVLLIDVSISASEKIAEKRDFISHIIKAFNVKEGFVHMAVVTFSFYTATLVSLKDGRNESVFFQALEKQWFPIGGQTYMGKAIKEVNERVLTEKLGDRLNVVNLIICITDAMPTDPIEAKFELLELRENLLTKFFIVLVQIDHEKQNQTITETVGYIGDPGVVLEVKHLNISTEKVAKNITSTTCSAIERCTFSFVYKVCHWNEDDKCQKVLKTESNTSTDCFGKLKTVKCDDEKCSEECSKYQWSDWSACICKNAKNASQCSKSRNRTKVMPSYLIQSTLCRFDDVANCALPKIEKKLSKGLIVLLVVLIIFAILLIALICCFAVSKGRVRRKLKRRLHKMGITVPKERTHDIAADLPLFTEEELREAEEKAKKAQASSKRSIIKRSAHVNRSNRSINKEQSARLVNKAQSARSENKAQSFR